MLLALPIKCLVFLLKNWKSEVHLLAISALKREDLHKYVTYAQQKN